MEFTVSRSRLLAELKLLQGAVESKTTIPILSNVLIEAVRDRIILTATDLETSICCSCPAKVKKEGGGTIPAKKLLDYIRLLPDSDIHLKIEPNEWASLRCASSRAKIVGMSRESFPALPVMGATVAELLAGELAAAIARTEFAISHEESKFTLNGALLVLRIGKAVMVTTDGHRLAFVERTHAEDVAVRALIPRKALMQLHRLASELASDLAIQFSSDDNHLFFQIGERLLLTRKLTGNFPDYERVLPGALAHSAQIERAAFKSAIERVAEFSDERSRKICLHFAPGELKLESQDAQCGESEDSLAIEYSGPSIDIALNAGYVLDFLKSCSSEKVSFGFGNEKAAMELRPVGDDGYRYVVMPMRD